VRVCSRAQSQAMLTTSRFSSPNLPTSIGRQSTSYRRSPKCLRLHSAAVIDSSGFQLFEKRSCTPASPKRMKSVSGKWRSRKSGMVTKLSKVCH